MAERPDIKKKKKKKEKQKETKKPCHRRTIRTYLYAAWPTVPGVAVMKAVNYGTSSPSPRKAWGSRDVYARPGDNVNTPRPVYGCIYHPMWLSTIRLSVLRLLVTVSYQPNVVYINGQACTCTHISIQSHPNVDPVSPKYRRLLTTIYAPKYRFQQVDISGVP